MSLKSINRTGRVSSIDYKAGTYEVTYFDRGKSVTRTINAMSNGEYKMPKVGQIVNVNHASNGAEMGTTTGTIWNKTNPPAEGYKGLYRKEYGTTAQGQAYERYDENTGVYTQYTDTRTGRNCKGTIYDEAAGAAYFTAKGVVVVQSRESSASIQAQTGVGIVAGETVSIEAGTAVSIEAATDMSISVGGKTTEKYTGEVEREFKDDIKVKVEADTEKEITGDTEYTITGDVTLNVTGNVTLTVGGATISISDAGDVSVSAPNVTVDGDAGDVTVAGISLKNHTHTSAESGSESSTPN